eukprot:TRINITY_DN29616_c0_g1_i2.p1 TRINITY_DN29616_c0_g1~~TRINITY_DN29616_c0_g1_i2.p1  ORF type:complete len:466 (+),score=113.67 TRINITY_DN29616_c0_g1_i2:55-1398(+)
MLHSGDERLSTFPPPDAVSYNTALWAVSHARAWECGLDLLGRMSSRRLPRCSATLKATTALFAGTSGAPLSHAVQALLHFTPGEGFVTRLSLEEAARRLESSAGSASSSTVAGQPLHHLAASPVLLPAAAAVAELDAEAMVLAAELEAASLRAAERAPEVLQDLQALLAARFPSLVLEVYGSLAEGTAGSAGDMDIVGIISAEDLYGTATQIGDGSLTQHARLLLAFQAVVDAVATSDAWSLRSTTFPKFPVYDPSVTLVHEPSASQVDFSLALSRAVCVEKTSMLLGLERGLRRAEVRRLASLTKFWARRRGVYGQAQGHLSGYAFTQLAVFFAQVAPTRPSPSLAQLLVGFFSFYARDFDWATECVSVATGRRVEKASRRFLGVRHLSIEDSVERWKDLGAAHLDALGNERLQQEFQRAAALLGNAESEASLEVLLTERRSDARN